MDVQVPPQPGATGGTDGVGGGDAVGDAGGEKKQNDEQEDKTASATTATTATRTIANVLVTGGGVPCECLRQAQNLENLFTREVEGHAIYHTKKAWVCPSIHFGCFFSRLSWSIERRLDRGHAIQAQAWWFDTVRPDSGSGGEMLRYQRGV